MENHVDAANRIPRSLNQRTIKVLVIEDEPSWQAILSHVLRLNRHRKIELRFVKSAKQATDMNYKEHCFDLILSDHFIDGDTTGLELWSQLKETYGHIPFILITAPRVSTLRASQYGSSRLLSMKIQKPFDLKSFSSIVDLYLGAR